MILAKYAAFVGVVAAFVGLVLAVSFVLQGSMDLVIVGPVLMATSVLFWRPPDSPLRDWVIAAPLFVTGMGWSLVWVFTH